MTALERQLTRAVRELSAQYEREQQLQTKRIEALEQGIEVCRQQLELSVGHVTRLTADYRTLAATLRGRRR